MSTVNLGTLAKDTGVPFVSSITTILSNILRGQNPDTHWEGWEKLDKKEGLPLGTNAQQWVIKDGDNPKSEAINIIRWADRYGIHTLVNYNSHFKKEITLKDVQSKLRRNGFINEAAQLNGVSLMDGLFSDTPNTSFNFPEISNSNFMDLLKKYFWIPAGLLLLWFLKKKRIFK